MNTVDNSKKALLAGLEQDIRKEIETMRSDAQKIAAERRDYYEKQLAQIERESQAKADAQAKAVHKSLLAGIDIEIRRNIMKLREQFFAEILREAENKIAARVSTPGYRDTIVGLIAEAAAGTGSPAARVNASLQERKHIDAAVLKEAEHRAAALTGQAVSLTLDAGAPLTQQGVVATSTDGRTAYDNRIQTRLARKQAQIRSLIYNELFAGEDAAKSTTAILHPTE